MYCKKCGSQIDNDSVFCPKCGANQTTSLATKETDEKMNGEQVNSQNIYSNTDSEESTAFVKGEPNNENHETKIQKKKRKKILIPAIAISLVVAFAIVGYATSFFGLFPALHAKTPVGLTLKSINAMERLSSAEFDLSVNHGGLRGSVSGYFVLGKDLKNSVLDIQKNAGSGRAVYHQGNYGVSSLDNDEYAYGYESGIDNYVVILFPDKAFLPEGYDNSLLLEDYENLLKYGESQINNAEDANEKRYYQQQLDIWQSNAVVINDLVQNKTLNTTRIQKIIEKIFEGQTNYTLKISDKVTKEAEELINDFVFIECEKESVYSKFIYDFNKSKSGNLNRYTFSLDASNFTVAFLEYFRNCLIDFPELERALDNYIKSVNSDNFFNTKGFIAYAIREIRNNLDEAPKISDIYVSMEIDKKNLLHLFEASLFDKYYGINSSISLQIKNHNKVKPDLDSINSFLDEAEKCAQTQSAYNKYLESKVEKINNQPDTTDCKTTEKKFFDFDGDGVLDLYYTIQYEQKPMGDTWTQEGLCAISSGKVVELFEEGEGGYSGYGGNAFISTAYSKDLSEHVICVVGREYEGADVLYHTYYSMENGELKPLDKLLYFKSPEDEYVKVNGKKVDEKTFFKAADKYAAPTNPDYIFTEYDWKPLRDFMEESGVQLGSITTSNATDTNAATINIDDYVGKWHINGQNYESGYVDAYETELHINKLNNNQFSFHLSRAHKYAIDCETKLNKSMADFKFDNGQYVVIGTLTFNESSITVNVTSSDMGYIPAGTMTFDSRHGGTFDDGRGDEEQTAIIPYLSSDLESKDSYISKLKNAGFVVDEGTMERDDYPEGTVIKVYPAQGLEVDYGSVVTVVYAVEPKKR